MQQSVGAEMHVLHESRCLHLAKWFLENIWHARFVSYKIVFWLWTMISILWQKSWKTSHFTTCVPETIAIFMGRIVRKHVKVSLFAAALEATGKEGRIFKTSFQTARKPSANQVHAFHKLSPRRNDSTRTHMPPSVVSKEKRPKIQGDEESCSRQNLRCMIICCLHFSAPHSEVLEH